MPSKNRVIYNIQNVSVGPAPATGYHFIDASGNLNNNLTDSPSNFNLVTPIHRVTSFGYDISLDYYNYRALGTLGTLTQTILNQPIVNLNFSYLQNGIANEAKMGFYVNYPRYGTDYSGTPTYSNNFTVFCLSGFLNRQPTRDNSAIGWPLSYRDRKNIFVSIGKTGGVDLNSPTFNPQNVDCIGFGNCYIVNYSTQGAIGGFPNCNVSYVGENMQFYNNGSGGLVPALSPKSGQNIQGVNFKVPSNYQQKNIPSVLLPGDISLSIASVPSFTGISALAGTGFSNGAANSTTIGLGVDFSDISLQSYSINLPIPREPLVALNFKLPVDRKVSFPLFADINFSLLENSLVTGRISDLTQRNDDYNITLKIKNKINSFETGNAVQYDILRAKYKNSSLKGSIGSNNLFNLSYQVELTPENLNRGLFMSGLMNIALPTNLLSELLEENSNFILQENGNLIEDMDSTFFYDNSYLF